MTKEKTVAIIGAMDCEVELLRNLLENAEEIKDKKFTIYKGKIGKHTVYAAQSGVGKVNSAVFTQYLIDKYSPDYIINTGIAGGVGGNLSVGDVVIATDLVQYDFDVTALGYAKGYMCTGINKDKPTVFTSDEKLSKEFETYAKQASSGNKIHRGRIASGDTFVASSDKKKEIKETFNAVAVEMEGCAIAQTASLNNIPFVIVRAISDLADGSAPKSLEEVEYESAQISSEVIRHILEQ